MRLMLATLFALLVLASPALASPVTNVTVDTTKPSSAAGARTSYVVAFTTSASGALSQVANSRLTFVFPAGTTFAGWFGGTVSVGGTDVGSCSSPSALTIQCSLFSGRTIAASTAVTVSLGGVTNPATQGARTLAVSTTADVDVVNSPFNVVSTGALNSVTLTNVNPSAAAGARTTYIATFLTSATGGLDENANSKIDVDLPAGTTFPGWFGGYINVGSTAVGSCSSPLGLRIECSLYSDRTIAPGTIVSVTLGGVTNSSAGAGKVVAVSTTSDPAPVNSAPFNVVAAGTLTNVSVRNSTPSAAAGARTSYAIGFTTSPNGGLAEDANSKIDVDLPAGTTFPGWFGGYINVGSTAVGSCSSPLGLRIECSLYSDRTIAPGTSVTVTLGGVTNPSATGAKRISVSTTSDAAAVDSADFAIVAAGTLSNVTIRNDDPSTAAGARTNYIVTFTASATGGLAEDANSKIDVDLPAGTTFAGWSGAYINVGSTAIGSCSSPLNLRVECSLYSDRVIAPGTNVTLSLNGVTNTAAGAGKVVAVSTTSDPQVTNSSSFAVDAGGTLSNVTVTAASLAGATNTGYVVRARVSATGGLAQLANSRITLTFPSGTTFPNYAGATVHDVTRGVNVGNCSSPAGFVIDCSLFSSQFVAPGDSLLISFSTVTNPAAGPPYQLTVATTSDTPAASSTPYTQGDIVAPDTSIDIGPNSPTPAAVSVFSFSSEPGASFECRLDAGAFAPCTSPFTTPALANGEHTTVVRARDAAGNPDATPASRTFNVQAVAPAAPAFVAPAPGAIVGSSTVIVSGTGETGSTVALLEGVSTLGSASVSGGTWSIQVSSVSEGPHTYTARATNLSGTSADATRSFQIKLGPPETTIVSGPSGLTNTSAPAFTFGTDTGTSFECSLGGAAYEACTSPMTYALADGDYSFSVRAVGTATDPTPATRTFRVDATAPDAPVITAPAESARLSSRTVVVTGTAEPGSTVAIREGTTSRGSASAGGGTWTVTIADAGDGSHTYEARATDAAGNTSAPAARTVLVDVAVATPAPIPTTAPTPPPARAPTPVPDFKKDVVVTPASGTVLVCDKPGGTCKLLTEGTKAPMGSTIDARKGAVVLTSIAAAGAPPQSARFYDGMFKVTQTGSTTDLTLNEPLAPCSSKKARAAAKKPKSRKLWGDGKGKFRTRGQYAAATIRGTKWLVQDSCAETLVRVDQGVVQVDDGVKHKKVTLRAKKSYTAKPRRR